MGANNQVLEFTGSNNWDFISLKSNMKNSFVKALSSIPSSPINCNDNFLNNFYLSPRDAL